jgi:hypothetical protein
MGGRASPEGIGRYSWKSWLWRPGGRAEILQDDVAGERGTLRRLLREHRYRPCHQAHSPPAAETPAPRAKLPGKSRFWASVKERTTTDNRSRARRARQVAAGAELFSSGCRHRRCPASRSRQRPTFRKRKSAPRHSPATSPTPKVRRLRGLQSSSHTSGHALPCRPAG